MEPCTIYTTRWLNSIVVTQWICGLYSSSETATVSWIIYHTDTLFFSLVLTVAKNSPTVPCDIRREGLQSMSKKWTGSCTQSNALGNVTHSDFGLFIRVAHKRRYGCSLRCILCFISSICFQRINSSQKLKQSIKLHLAWWNIDLICVWPGCLWPQKSVWCRRHTQSVELRSKVCQLKELTMKNWHANDWCFMWLLIPKSKLLLSTTLRNESS